MLYNNVCIEAYGYELPKNVVSSEEIERRLSPLYERLKLPYGRLEMFTGIKERRFWDDNVKPSDVSILAAKKAISNADISVNDIGCLIHASVCKDFLEPATATVVHSALKLPADSSVFDVSNACLGFINAMMILANMIELGQVKSGLIVAGETGERLVDTTIEELVKDKAITRKEIKDYFASLTIGSGAVAVVLTHSSISKAGHRFLGGRLKSNTEYNNLCVGGINSQTAHEGHVSMKTDADFLLVHGVALASEIWDDFKVEFGWNDVDKVFCHQVGIAYKKALFDKLKLDKRKDFATLEYLGNTGSAALPLTMAIGIEKGVLETGDKIAMFGIGSGLNCTVLGVEW